LIALLVVGWNLWQKDHTSYAIAASKSADYLSVDPEVANTILAKIDEYTPLIHESAVDMTLAVASEEQQGFVGADSVTDRFTTKPTELEIQYTVQPGDTVSGIAQRYGLHVATLVNRNNLSTAEIESIKPGKTIVIPPQDTSDSKDWLVALNKQKEEERVKALVARQRAATLSRSSSRSSARTGYSGVAGLNFIVPIHHNGISRGLILDVHYGIDYRANIGTPVMAAQTGKVVQTTGGWGGGFGNSILVDHGNGLTTRYAHLSRISVRVGRIVSRGQVIGYSGNTGNSTGPHLHFETRLHGRAINPF